MKKVLSALIALTLCAAMVLGACGNTQSGGTTTAPAETQAAAPAQTQAAAPAETQAAAPAETQAAAPAETQAAAPAETQAAAPAEEEEEDIATIELYSITFVPPADIQHVEDAINEITEKEIAVHVHLNILDVGTFIAQIGTMIAAGETIDLKVDGFASAAFGSLMSQHQLMDITDILEKYGQDILNHPLFAEKIKGFMRDGRIYGVPRLGNVNGNVYIIMRKDVLDDLGLTEKAMNMTSTQEMWEICEAVHNSEKWSYLRPFEVSSGSGLYGPGYVVAGNFSDCIAYDRLGDDLNLIGVDENGKVFLQMESDAYYESFKEAQAAQAKGLIYHDLAGQTFSMNDNIKSDLLFAYCGLTNFGAEIEYPINCGMDVVIVKCVAQIIDTTQCTDWGWEVPVTAKEPEAAVKFLNLCMTNSDLNNLMAWGVEGTDYVVEDGVAKYIPGTEFTAFHMEDFRTPNAFLCTPWDGHPVDFYEQAEADMYNASYSKYLGFAADLSSVSTELAACAAVIDEYDLQIKTGEGSDQVYQDYIDKLYASGAQKIKDTYQEQLDAWCAENGIK